MIPAIGELDNCKTLEAIDSFLDAYLKANAKSFDVRGKCDFLVDYMGIIGMHFDGGECADQDLLYSLLRESFCDGDWRLLCGERS